MARGSWQNCPAIGHISDGVVVSRSALVAPIAAVVVTVLAVCLPGTALALPSAHRADGHYVYTCLTVRDRAKGDVGKICINAFMDPYDQETTYRARASFRSTSGGKLSRASAAELVLKLGRRKHGNRRDPKASARHGATVLRMVTAWIPDPHNLNPTGVVKNACLTWRNGGRACHRGYFRGGIPGYIS